MFIFLIIPHRPSLFNINTIYTVIYSTSCLGFCGYNEIIRCACGICAKRCRKAMLSSPCAGFTPIVTLLYQYSLSFAWNTVRYLESGWSSSCQNAGLKSIFENTFAPLSLALICSCFRMGRFDRSVNGFIHIASVEGHTNGGIRFRCDNCVWDQWCWFCWWMPFDYIFGLPFFQSLSQSVPSGDTELVELGRQLV